MSAKTILKHALLIVVWVSVGVAIGREFPRQQARPTGPGGPGPATATTAPAAKPDRTVVYYFHGPKRCDGCNLVETYAREVLDAQFAKALAGGDLEFVCLDYTVERGLAAQYNVAGNMIVVARLTGGKEVDSRRLDDIMLRRHDKDDFFGYVGDTIRELQGEAGR